jgi:hypothetical protein
MRRTRLPDNPFPDLQAGDVLLLSKPRWLYANGAKETFRAHVLAVREHAGIVIVDCWLSQRDHLVSVLTEWCDGVERKERKAA